jgi:hypothetical protein
MDAAFPFLGGVLDAESQEFGIRVFSGITRKPNPFPLVFADVSNGRHVMLGNLDLAYLHLISRGDSENFSVEGSVVQRTHRHPIRDLGFPSNMTVRKDMGSVEEVPDSEFADGAPCPVSADHVLSEMGLVKALFERPLRIAADRIGT